MINNFVIYFNDNSFKENFTHLIGYVSQANQDDIESTQAIKKNFVPGLKVGKVGLEKTFEEKL